MGGCALCTPYQTFLCLPPHPRTLHAWCPSTVPGAVLSGPFSCPTPRSSQSKDRTEEACRQDLLRQSRHAHPTVCRQQIWARTQMPPPPRSVFLCLCNLLPASVCLLVLLVLESAPDSLSGYNSRVLSLTHICLGTACVGLSRDGSTSWARLLSSSRCACPSGLCAQAKGLRVVLP